MYFLKFLIQYPETEVNYFREMRKQSRLQFEILDNCFIQFYLIDILIFDIYLGYTSGNTDQKTLCEQINAACSNAILAKFKI